MRPREQLVATNRRRIGGGERSVDPAGGGDAGAQVSFEEPVELIVGEDDELVEDEEARMIAAE